MQYHNILIQSLTNCKHFLFAYLWDIYSVMLMPVAARLERGLAKIAMRLYYCDTTLFYKMLECMQSYDEDPSVQQLAKEIRTKIMEFDPLTSSGMCICFRGTKDSPDMYACHCMGPRAADLGMSAYTSGVPVF